VRLLLAVQAVHPDRIGWIPAHFDRLAGGRSLREAIVAGRLLGEIVKGWGPAIQAFEARRERYLLYSR